MTVSRRRLYDMNKNRTNSVRFNLLLHLPHVLRYVFIALLILALIGCAVLGLRGCSRRRHTVADGGIEIRGASVGAQYFSMKNAFIAFDGSYARAYDAKKGELLWEVTPDGTQGFQCAVSSDLMALYKAGMLYVYDSTGRVSFSTSSEENISDVAVGVSRAAIRYQDDSIRIIDSTGKEVERIENAQGQVLDFGLYSASDLMWVLTLNAAGIEPECTLNIYQPGKLLIAGYSTTDQLYYQPIMHGSTICIAGTQTIDIRNTNDMSESSILTYGWTLRDWYAGNDLTILMALTEQGDDPTALRIIRGQTQRDVRMHAGCTDLMLGETYIYGFSGSTIIGVPVAGGATQSWSLPYNADAVLCRLSGSRALLSGNGKVYLVELP